MEYDDSQVIDEMGITVELVLCKLSIVLAGCALSLVFCGTILVWGKIGAAASRTATPSFTVEE